MARILIIDDESEIRRTLKSALDRRGHDTVTAENCAKGQDYITAGFDLVFLDVMLPDGNGLGLLRQIIAQRPEQAVVMISGHADVDMAVDAIRAGAYDFIEKPLSLDRVLVTIDNALGKSRLVSETKRLDSRLYGDFVGRSQHIIKLKADIEKSAAKTSQFLILGENGTGKELVARMIHRCGRTPNGPFVAVNCAALPAELVESELFGHVPGAFTGALKARRGYFLEADNGTIFLDEISEMTMAAQAKILRAIEVREISPVGSDKKVPVSCTIIAASNKSLEQMVQDGTFREDLLYRLNVVQFVLPPLRDRVSDIPILCTYFLQRFAGESGTGEKHLSDEALELLKRYPFPGNIRELKNLMERVHIYCDIDPVGAVDLKALLPKKSPREVVTLKDAVEKFEREYIEEAIARNDGNMSETARQLGLERSHLYKKVKKLEKE
ncbi:MAG: sigma-54-dependent Fis family transcriptional regulator [candidate division Zixibacteria bacterium]|nr:sigma-54-dependent Fis family transcriptional regulator [candidate division Zixibacteria bacterium]